jgi:hypothetical protein
MNGGAYHLGRSVPNPERCEMAKLGKERLFFGGGGVISNDRFLPARPGVQSSDPVRNLPVASVVSDSLFFSSPQFGTSMMHIGDVTGQFKNGTEGYLGFKFDRLDDGAFAQKSMIRSQIRITFWVVHCGLVLVVRATPLLVIIDTGVCVSQVIGEGAPLASAFASDGKNPLSHDFVR